MDLLFTSSLAFSLMAAGKPKIYMSHGLYDNVLSIDACSRRIISRLQSAGYLDTEYAEFDGSHTVPKPIAMHALEWFLRNPEA
jgi:phospholipase/carboxylesterase